MRYLQGLIVAAASINLAIGAPVSEAKSRDIVAKEAVRRSLLNNPYIRSANADPEAAAFGPQTPKKTRSLVSLLRRSALPYKYSDTPRPSKRSSAVDLNKRDPYKYVDTPRASKRSSAVDLNKRDPYKYGDTPRVSRRSSVEDLNKRAA